MQERAYQPDLLQLCNPLVKKCYGCGQMLKHISGNDNSLPIPPPPHDLVFCTTTVLAERGQLTNVSFHCLTKCARLMQPAFIPFLVYIPVLYPP